MASFLMRAHSAPATPAKIELIKTLIEDESTIGYEGQRNETKAAPVSH